MQSIPLNKLVLSPLNVRKTKPEQIEGLADNIFANGQIHNVVGTDGEDDLKEVVAGGRRLAAMQLLAKDGRWPEDHPVSIEIVDRDKAIEISLSENALRKDMHPADQFEAFYALSKQSMSDEDIAARFGISALGVAQRLKLAVVSPKLMKLYREDKMTLAHLQAFTLTDDRKQQEKVWKDLPAWAKEQAHGAREIKAALTKEMTDAKHDQLAKFVGLKAYEEAGGNVVKNLFDGEGGGYITDTFLLGNLANEKMEAAKAKVLKEGWSFAEVATGMDWQTKQAYGQITPTLSDEQAAEITKLHERLQEIENIDHDSAGDEEDALIAEQEKIESQIDQIEHEAKFTEEDKSRAGVLLSIGHDGKLVIERGRLTPEATKADRKAARAAGKDAGSGEGAPKVEGHSAALVEALTAHRTAALQARMASNPHVALATAVQALIASTTPTIFIQPLAKITARMPSYNGTGEEIEKSLAGKELAKREKAVTKGMPEDGRELLGWLIKQTDRKLLDIMAVCVANTLDTVETKMGTKPDADAIQTLRNALDLDMTAYWQPSAEGYFAKVSKDLIVEAVKDGCGADGVVDLGGGKKADMCKRAETLMKGRGWLPQLMR